MALPPYEEQNPQTTGPEKSQRYFIVTLLLIVCICILGVATGVFIFLNKNHFTQPQQQQQQEPLPQPLIQETPVSLISLGDMMFHRGVRTKIKKVGDDIVFSSSTFFLTQKYDIAVANLEGPITNYPSKTVNAEGVAIPGFSFTFPTSTATLLKKSGVDIVSLANNHTDNFGNEGLRQTITYLKNAGVHFFGNPTNDASANAIAPISERYCIEKPQTSNINDSSWCLTMIGYHEFTPSANSTDSSSQEASLAERAILKEIEAARDGDLAGIHSDYIVVMPHWGVEYESYPNQKQIRLAHTWIDAGADAVIGAHPHTIQSMEEYNGKIIFYSLGNYIFDQYFSYNTTHALAVGITLGVSTNPADTSNTTKLQKLTLHPIDITGTMVQEAGDIDRIKILNSLATISKAKVSTSTYESIVTGNITITP